MVSIGKHATVVFVQEWNRAGMGILGTVDDQNAALAVSRMTSGKSACHSLMQSTRDSNELERREDDEEIRRFNWTPYSIKEREHPLMTSAKFSDFLTHSPLSTLGTDL